MLWWGSVTKTAHNMLHYCHDSQFAQWGDGSTSQTPVPGVTAPHESRLSSKRTGKFSEKRLYRHSAPRRRRFFVISGSRAKKLAVTLGLTSLASIGFSPSCRLAQKLHRQARIRKESINRRAEATISRHRKQKTRWLVSCPKITTLTTEMMSGWEITGLAGAAAAGARSTLSREAVRCLLFPRCWPSALHRLPPTRRARWRS